MKCPGQDTRYWKPGAIFEVPCPVCGKKVEFFKDDPKRTCTMCGHRFANPKLDFGCATYCPYGEQCMPDQAASEVEMPLKDRVAAAMKQYFGGDCKRIGHAAKVAEYAERICEETGGDLVVVLCAAYLHDIGIREAERKYQSTAPRYQHREGPPIARNILVEAGGDTHLVEEVCDIVGHHHHPRKDETLNFKIIYDADLIVNLEEEQKERPDGTERFREVIEKRMFTEAGKRIARASLPANE